MATPVAGNTDDAVGMTTGGGEDGLVLACRRYCCTIVVNTVVNVVY